MNARYSLIIVVTAWLLLSSLAQAVEPVVVPATGNTAIELTRSLEFFVPDSALTYSDIINTQHKITFTPYAGMQDIVRGRDMWFRFHLSNPSASPRDYVLDLNQILIDEIELHYQTHGSTVHYLTGLEHPLATRAIAHRNISFPLQLPAGETRDIYLRLKVTFYSGFAPTLVDTQHFPARIDNQNLMTYIPTGILLAVLLYVVFVYMNNPATENICAMFWFAFFGLVSLLLFNGQLVPLFDHRPYLFDITYSWVFAGIMTSMMSLARQYFDTRDHYPRLYRLLTAGIFVGPVFVILPFLLDNTQMRMLIYNYSVAVALTLNISGLYLWLRHPQARNYYCYGLVVFTLFTSLSMLASHGIVDYSFLSRYGYHIGISLQTLAFLFAIAEKNQWLLQEKQALIRENAIATEKNNAKNEILAKVSHEVLTPINGIMGMMDALQDSHITPAQQQFLSTMRYSANNLMRIVNDILDFRKIDAGQLELHLVPCDFSQVMQNIIHTVNHSAPGISTRDFHTEIDPAIPPWLLMDPERLSQVISHLLSNAHKFTEKGAVTFSARLCEPVQHQHCLITFSVQDTGIGIDNQDRDRLFQAFSQSDNSITRSYGGVGLGLIICKEIIELMGGRIVVESTPGDGSTFRFTLRFTLCDKPLLATRDTAAASSLANDATRTHPLRILVAEDNDVNRIVILGLLDKLAADAVCVNNGEQALLTLQQQHADFDLVLMDCEMPKMDGYTATRLIREHEQHYHLPPMVIIALTAHASDDFVVRSIAAGMNDHLSKPINLDALRTSIQKNLPAGKQT